MVDAVTQRRRSRGGWETEQEALLGPGLGLGPAPPPLSPFNSEAPPWRHYAQIAAPFRGTRRGRWRRVAGNASGDTVE